MSMSENINGLRGGPRIKVPDGDTVESLVKYGMALKTTSSQTHKILGISLNAYALVRKLLLLQNDPSPSDYEQTIIAQAITLINETRQIYEAKKITRGILKRYWSYKTRAGRTQQELEVNDKAKRRFEKMVFMVREICTNNDEIEIPMLTKAEKNQVIDDLIESIGALSKLITHLQQHKGKGNGHDN